MAFATPETDEKTEDQVNPSALGDTFPTSIDLNPGLSMLHRSVDKTSQ